MLIKIDINANLMYYLNNDLIFLFNTLIYLNYKIILYQLPQKSNKVILKSKFLYRYNKIINDIIIKFVTFQNSKNSYRF